MKKIFGFFVMIYKWFVSLFKVKKEEKKTLAQVYKEQRGDSYGRVKYSNHPVVPEHNNRKVTRGRFVQYISLPDGTTRPIYH